MAPLRLRARLHLVADDGEPLRAVEEQKVGFECLDLLADSLVGVTDLAVGRVCVGNEQRMGQAGDDEAGDDARPRLNRGARGNRGDLSIRGFRDFRGFVGAAIRYAPWASLGAWLGPDPIRRRRCRCR